MGSCYTYTLDLNLFRIHFWVNSSKHRFGLMTVRSKIFLKMTNLVLKRPKKKNPYTVNPLSFLSSSSYLFPLISPLSSSFTDQSHDLNRSQPCFEATPPFSSTTVERRLHHRLLPLLPTCFDFNLVVASSFLGWFGSIWYWWIGVVMGCNGLLFAVVVGVVG